MGNEKEKELTPEQEWKRKELAEAAHEEEIRKQVIADEFEKRCAAVKAKHPKAHLLKVDDKIAFLKPMSRQVLSMATTIGSGDEVRICELLLDACWIEGDEEIRTDDEYFIPAMGEIKLLMTVKKAELVKL